MRRDIVDTIPVSRWAGSPSRVDDSGRLSARPLLRPREAMAASYGDVSFLAAPLDPAAIRDMAAFPQAEPTPNLRPAAMGAVAETQRAEVRVRSDDVRRRWLDLRTDPRRPDRACLGRDHEDRDGESQRDEDGPYLGTPPSTGNLSRHDLPSFPDGTLARSGAEGPTRLLRIACDTAAERLRSEDSSSTAGRVVRPVGQKLLPLLRGEAPSRDRACSF
jgi:hypothetical protein